MTFSIPIYSFATAGLATSHSLWQLIAWRTLVGLGMGGEWSCGSVLVAETWPAEHRGKAMGLDAIRLGHRSAVRRRDFGARPRPLRMARALPRWSAAGRGGILHPANGRGAADLARARAQRIEFLRDVPRAVHPKDDGRHARGQQRVDRLLGTDLVGCPPSSLLPSRRVARG